MSDTLNSGETRPVQPTHYVDRQDIPQWGTAPDGKMVPIGDDDRLPALFVDWLADACDHPETFVVRKDDSLGRHQYFRYCGHCGTRLTSAISHREAGTPSDYTAGDMEERSEAYRRDRQAQLDRITGSAAERAQNDSRASYDDYLRSDAWKRRAAAIMERDKGVCQGCLGRPATQVHHLTYAHVRNEFAFELVALCHTCHARLHEAAE